MFIMEDAVKKLESLRKEYSKQTVKVVDGLLHKPKDILKKVELYYNSTYESGSKNKQGLDKPFYNIVKFRVNVATTATDLDTKDIQITTDNPENYSKVWLFQKEVEKWMKESDFAKFLNDVGQTRAKYGSAFVKKVESDGKLTLEVCNIHNLEFDATDFSVYTPLFETHYMTPAQLYEKEGVWDNVQEAIEYGKMKTGSRFGEYQRGDVKIIEVVGRLDGEIFGKEGYPLMHAFYCCSGKSDDGVILFQEELKVENYKMIKWDEVPCRALGVGVVEDGFEAQRWSNDVVQRQKSMLDIASKIIFHTDDDTLGNNVLVELENGDVIKTADGKSFSQVNSVPSSMPAFTEFLSQWDQQLERVTSTFNAFTGETMPSGTPYRAVATLNQAAGTLFAYRMEQMGIFLTEVFEDWIFPYIEKKLTRAHILSEDFSPEDLAIIDNGFARASALERSKQVFLEGNIVSGEMYQMVYDEALKSVNNGSQRRFLDIPDGFYKNMNAKVDIIITGENKNKGVVLESLARVLADVSANPALLENPTTKKIFQRIVEMSDIGISPLELESIQPAQQELAPVV